MENAAGILCRKNILHAEACPQKQSIPSSIQPHKSTINDAGKMR
jgi:hypothetical protein